MLIVAIGIEVVAFTWSQRQIFTGSGLASIEAQIKFALVILMGTSLGLALSGVPRMLPGAVVLAMDSEVLHLVYPSGLREKIYWRDTAGFVLLDSSAVPEMVQANRAYVLSGPHYWRRRTLLTEGAMRAILGEARTRDVRISARRSRPKSASPAATVYRIRARP